MADATNTAGWTVPTIGPQENALPTYLLKWGAPNLDVYTGLANQIGMAAIPNHIRNSYDFGRWQFSGGVPQPDTVPLNWGLWPKAGIHTGGAGGGGLLGNPTGQSSYGVGTGGLLSSTGPGSGIKKIPNGEATGSIGWEGVPPGNGTGGTGNTGGSDGVHSGANDGTTNSTPLPSYSDNNQQLPMDTRYFDYVYVPYIGWIWQYKAQIDPKLVNDTQTMQSAPLAVANWSGVTPDKYKASNLYNPDGTFKGDVTQWPVGK